MAQQDINPLHLLMRHVNGDDGDLSADDKALNADAIASGCGARFTFGALAAISVLTVVAIFSFLLSGGGLKYCLSCSSSILSSPPEI